MAQDETDQDVLAQEDSKVRIQGGASAARPRLRGLPMSKPSPLQTVTHIAAWKPLSQVQHRVRPIAAGPWRFMLRRHISQNRRSGCIAEMFTDSQ
jgi:hypothetical protein